MWMRVFFASAPVKTRAALPTRVVRRLWRVANARPALAGVASTDEPPMDASASAELHPHVSHVLFSEDVLRSRIQEMACELNVAYQNGPPPLLLQVRGGWSNGSVGRLRCVVSACAVARTGGGCSRGTLTVHHAHHSLRRS